MHYLIGFILISLFYSLSSFIIHEFQLPIPSSILGMILLFISLKLRIVPYLFVKDACKLFIAFMPLFFIPASMGLVVYFPELKANSLALVGSTLLSSLIVFILMAYCIEQRLKGKN